MREEGGGRGAEGGGRGLRDRAQAARGVALARLGQHEASVGVIEGLDGVVGPDPGKGLGHFRWAIGRSCRVGVEAECAGRARLIVHGRTELRGQRVSVACNGTESEWKELPSTVQHGDRDYLLFFEIRVREGDNLIDLRFERWQVVDGRALAMRLTGLNLIPAP